MMSKSRCRRDLAADFLELVDCQPDQIQDIPANASSPTASQMNRGSWSGGTGKGRDGKRVRRNIKRSIAKQRRASRASA
jgi:hypothetical protein